MAATNDGPRATWRRSDGEAVEFADAEPAWIAAARQELLDTAGRYGAYVTYRQLADRMFEVTGVETRMLLTHLMPKILGPVAQDGHERGEPPLTALCVKQTGEEVGPAYRLVVELADEPMPADLDKHAAEARHRCYAFFGADLPAGGGRPALTRKVAAARERAAKREPRAAVICTTCYLQLPPSGRCPNCAA
jgi:hypothetical protein